MGAVKRPRSPFGAVRAPCRPRRTAMTYSFRLRAWQMAALPLLLLISGCGEDGPKRYPVHGYVRYRGKPVTVGTVMFVPERGPAASGVIESDGSYSLRAVEGRHQIAVTAVPPPPQGVNPMAGSEEYVPPPPLVPSKFSRPATSGLNADVRPDKENALDLDMQ